MRRNERQWLSRTVTDTQEASMDVKLFNFVLPIQPENPQLLQIAIIGAPNAGKSTLINRFVGTKISAVSPKSHTTRTSTLGIITTGSTQLCFVDTPGIIDKGATTKSTRQLTLAAWQVITDVDLVMVIVDSVKTITGDKDLAYIIENLSELQKKQEKFTTCYFGAQ